MLPTTYFERITSAYGLRSFNAPRERRAGVRVDLRCKALVYILIPKAGIGVTVGAGVPARIREVSNSGSSLLYPVKMRLGQEFLLRLESREGPPYWLWCRCRRNQAIDDLSTLVGLVFMRVLYPGQTITMGASVSSALWLDVEGPITPEDPFVSEPRAA